jgi:hypothetical protein
MSNNPIFVMFNRTNGSQVACRISQVLYVGRGAETGSILHFGGDTQVNVHESFEEVIALLSAKS